MNEHSVCRLRGRGFDSRIGTFFHSFFSVSFFSLSFSFMLAPPFQCSSIFLVSFCINEVIILFVRSHDIECFHTVPAPTVSHNFTSTGPLIAGGVNITLTCSALLDLTVVDTEGILYSFTWRDRAGVEIVSGDRITISQFNTTTAFSSLTLSPLTTMDTNFTCAVEASVVQNNTLLPSDSAMTSISLDVEGELCPPSLCLQPADCPSPH